MNVSIGIYEFLSQAGAASSDSKFEELQERTMKRQILAIFLIDFR
jgi:hypothetical protein